MVCNYCWLFFIPSSTPAITPALPWEQAVHCFDLYEECSFHAMVHTCFSHKRRRLKPKVKQAGWWRACPNRDGSVHLSFRSLLNWQFDCKVHPVPEPLHAVGRDWKRTSNRSYCIGPTREKKPWWSKQTNVEQCTCQAIDAEARGRTLAILNATIFQCYTR